MKTIIDFWKQRKIRIIVLILFTAVHVFLALMFPYLLRGIIDGIQRRFIYRELLKALIWLLAIGITRSLASIFLPYLRGRTNEIFNYHERLSIFRHLLGMGHSFLNRFPIGDTLERSDADLAELSWFVCSGLFRPIEGTLTLIIGLYFLCRIDPVLTIVSVLPMSVTIFGFIRLSPLIYKYFQRWREIISRMHTSLQSNFTGIRVIKAYTLEEQCDRDFRALLDQRINAAVKSIRAEAKMNSMFSSFEEIGIVLVLLFGGLAILHGRLTIGEFVAFNAYILLLLEPMIDIGNFFVVKKRAEVQVERIEEIKNFPPEVPDDSRESAPSSAALECRRVSFRYAENRPDVLKGIEIKIEPGQKIGLAGTVGSGKTTLVKLLMRIAQPSAGQIFLGDRDIRQIKLDDYRRRFGYVPQDPSLFSANIKENILFGRDHSTEELHKVINLSQLGDLIQQLPDHLEQMIGERGLKLSGGEKQRIAIARALLDRPPILIFDDATSNLDASTEKELIARLTADRTVTLVIISHRLSILAACDWIYVLDQGRIVEAGQHTGLIKKKGLYWKLYRYQTMIET